jgi:hypothetical protein
MNNPGSSVQSSTPPQAAAVVMPSPYALDGEDYALGCECANPALQIDVWARGDDAQPLQQFC